MAEFPDAHVANPFYLDPNDTLDDHGMDRPPTLNIGELGDINA